MSPTYPLAINEYLGEPLFQLEYPNGDGCTEESKAVLQDELGMVFPHGRPQPEFSIDIVDGLVEVYRDVCIVDLFTGFGIYKRKAA